jgi:hypothetical protein
MVGSKPGIGKISAILHSVVRIEAATLLFKNVMSPRGANPFIDMPGV